MDENPVWDVRAFVYRYFIETTRPPRVDEVASHFDLTQDQAAEVYLELHRRHALFLAPGSYDIQMAWPFSGVETPFKVHAKDKTFYANCAWDSLGTPVALQADAEIEAVCAQSGEAIQITVRGQKVRESDALVHFLVPFRDWYNDLPFT